MLQLEHVKKSYDKKEVLTDVTYTFEEGKVYSLLGGAGAGRTTLLECICGDLSIDDGTIVTKEKEDIFLASKQSILPMYISVMNLYIIFVNFRNRQESLSIILNALVLMKKSAAE